MIPVCPACRAQISLHSHLCHRCGLAVRPTCSACGEALRGIDVECFYCFSPIEDVVPPTPPPPPPPTAVMPMAEAPVPTQYVPAPPPPPVPIERPPVAYEPPAPVTQPIAEVPPVPVRSEHRYIQPEPEVVAAPRRSRVGAIVFTGVIASLLLSIGLLAFESFVPRFTSTTVPVGELDRRNFPDDGFTIAYPVGWRVVEDRYGVSFYSAELAGKTSTRGFRVERENFNFKNVRTESQRIDTKRYPGHELFATARGRTRSGEDAYKRVVGTDGLRIEQWWIERDKDILRLEFWQRMADDDASPINDRIVKSLEIV